MSFTQYGVKGTLTVTSENQRIQLTLFGQYANSFSATSDGEGGTLIAYAPPPQQAALAPPAH